uniref:Odorant receptor 43a n=1 Tax=Lygus hesperus TaxID=30085 RepID=A0A0A9XXM9_LYGHE
MIGTAIRFIGYTQIKLNRELKDFLGPTCAFQSLFTSLVLTLTVFTTTVTTDITVVLAYGTGAFFYFAAGLLYCSLGQLLQNQSSEVFEALCDLPWYRSSPDVRKSLNMMIRQSHNPLIIDYHGHSKMNLENFMQILRSSYSYFTLLQSMTSSE